MVSPRYTTLWKTPLLFWGLLAACMALIGWLYLDGLKEMVDFWDRSKEYGHGYMIPVVALLLVWQLKDELERMGLYGAWTGLAIILVALVTLYIGHVSTIFSLIQYGFILMLAGFVYTLGGWPLLRKLWAPLVFLLFMVPLPDFINIKLSAKLQLISSDIGVAIIRLFGIGVFQEGNVIDLGSLRMQVVEACSGLRYLFPLTGLAFLAAYLFHVPFWQRLVVFLSSVPITIFMNSFRIGMIGILVEYGGPAQAEGFLHDFEGWVIFVACLSVLAIEMWLLNRFFGQGRPLLDVLVFELPAQSPKGAAREARPIPMPLWGALALLAVTTLAFPSLQPQASAVPARQDFAAFPLSLGSWTGKTQQLESIYLDELKLDDYLLADYADTDQRPVNLYLAWYADQNKGHSAHSPRTCLPGGGWEITSLTEITLPGVTVDGRPVRANRVAIQKDEYRQLVYYWFQQRGRNVTNEYMVKWFILQDAIVRGRTDGALVRLTMLLKPGENVAEADARLSAFAAAAVPAFGSFIPN